MITVEDSATIQRPVEQVFLFLTDPRNEPKWHTDVTEASLTSESSMALGSTVKMKVKSMGVKDMIVEVTEYEPNRKIRLDTKTAKPSIREQSQENSGVPRMKAV